jgi:hypothetical protein
MNTYQNQRILHASQEILSSNQESHVIGQFVWKRLVNIDALIILPWPDKVSI